MKAMAPLLPLAALLALPVPLAAVRLKVQEPEAECPEESACPEIQSAALRTVASEAASLPGMVTMSRSEGAFGSEDINDGNDHEEHVFPPANVSLPHMAHPTMFVAVFSAPRTEARRHAARWAWHSAKRMTVKFVMCSDPPDPVALAENKKYQDIAFIDCEEGYKDGKLTKKLVATMKYYREQWGKVPYFFKTDDDTFVQSRELLRILLEANSSHVYAGLFYHKKNVPMRNPSSKWYQPEDVYPEKYYPPCCAGGPGYALSQALVDAIFNASLPERYPLTNEDKAAGVWVRKAEEAGVPVSRVEVYGTDGYRLNKCEAFRDVSWNRYDLILQHKVKPKELQCMGRDWKGHDGLAQCFCLFG